MAFEQMKNPMLGALSQQAALADLLSGPAIQQLSQTKDAEDTPERLAAMRSRGLDDMDDYLNGHSFRWTDPPVDAGDVYMDNWCDRALKELEPAKYWLEELHPPTVPAWKALWSRLVAHWTWIWFV